MASIVDEFEPVNGTADRDPGSDGSDGENETEGGAGGHRVRSRAPKKSRRRRAGSRTRTRTSRALTLENAAREYVWLWELRRGVSITTIAKRECVSLRRVRFGVARARAQEGNLPNAKPLIRPPQLVPLFPIGAFTPMSLCGHRQPIRIGSDLCCMVCHRSGMDGHPALQRDKATEPAREPVPSAPKPKTSRETRKQRRQRLFASKA